jgi:hypothetical protein
MLLGATASGQRNQLRAPALPKLLGNKNRDRIGRDRSRCKANASHIFGGLLA